MKKIFSLALLCIMAIFTSCKDEQAIVVTADQVSLNKATFGLIVGTTETLVATISPENVSVKDITWMSCDEKVAKVSQSGVVTAVSVGEATITAVTVSGGKSASCVVIVSAAPVAVTGVTLDKTTLSLAPNTKQALMATMVPTNATNSKVKWSSDNDKVATVSVTGEVTAIADGSAKITVTTEDGNKTATCAVTVAVPVTGVTLNKSTLSLILNEKQTLVATVAPANATNSKVKWSSDNDKVVTVSATGEVTAIAIGSVTITATTEDGGKIATCVVKAGPKTPPYIFYGSKDNKVAYFDGTELKTIEGATGRAIKYAFTIGQDFYAISMSEPQANIKSELYKNGVLFSVTGIIPVDDDDLKDVYSDGTSVYSCTYSSDGTSSCWKKDEKLFTVPVSGRKRIDKVCALNGDAYAFKSSEDGSKIQVYKNSNGNLTEYSVGNCTSLRVESVTVYKNKLYITISNYASVTENDVYLCSLDASGFTKVASKSGSTVVSIGSIDRDNFFTAIKNNGETSIYKNELWDAPLPKLSAVDGYTGFPTRVSVVNDGDDIHTYGTFSGDEYGRNKRVYHWTNSIDPVRMPADTVRYVIHKK